MLKTNIVSYTGPAEGDNDITLVKCDPPLPVTLGCRPNMVIDEYQDENGVFHPGQSHWEPVPLHFATGEDFDRFHAFIRSFGARLRCFSLESETETWVIIGNLTGKYDRDSLTAFVAPKSLRYHMKANQPESQFTV